ncbi:flagellar brake protein [Undibacterium cyanobacteriorum]|uniref:Flagellar brake protein n=1 Tax=Undibacterium cyanobacteriorum TaxID=3073561 RepID=A0ABY9RDY7_9BURK|nr:flagellar brake protein [Undibacterium sp. 20NA77.5]WMW79069.1 flagellar brake protein [Undibacterium sp. 20NA77.5]
MSQLGALTPVEKDKIALGVPLPWAIFDAWGNQIHDAGSVITDQNEFDSIVEDGYFEDSLEDPNNDQKPLPAPTQSNTFSQPAPKITVPNVPLEPIIQPTSISNANEQDELNKESVMLDLDSVRWHVGETFFLQVHDNAAIRYTVKLIGYVKNQSILVTAPRIDGRGAIIRDGQTFIVRAFPGKKAYAFTAYAIKSVYTPHAYLHLSYPKIVRCTTIRQNSRASVKIIASVTVGTPEQTAAATLSDISMGGTSGIIKRQIGAKGDTGVIKFKVTTAGEDAYLTLPIIVRSIVETENADEFRYGFEFFEVPTQSKLILSSFVHQTLAETE